MISYFQYIVDKILLLMYILVYVNQESLSFHKIIIFNIYFIIEIKY